jgi:hypothetical protein
MCHSTSPQEGQPVGVDLVLVHGHWAVAEDDGLAHAAILAMDLGAVMVNVLMC